ncbi:hypothetical protein [Sediminibacterium ginsengisoli]|nr:hypothetical protein [Sediminibacterium ginsengisoli]
MNANKSTLFSCCCFIISAAITVFFILGRFWLYDHIKAMWLSGIIALGKWAAAVFSSRLLPQQLRPAFLRKLSITSLWASVLLLSYYLIPFLPVHVSGLHQLIVAIGLSVIVTAGLHYKTVVSLRLPLRWWFVWLLLSGLSWLLQWQLIL